MEKLNVPFSCVYRVLLVHIILTDFKCILFYLRLQRTGICASENLIDMELWEGLGYVLRPVKKYKNVYNV